MIILYLIHNLPDNWNYYHGGIHDFLGWRGQSQLEGVENNCVCNIEDQHVQDAFFTDTSIIGDFKDYVRDLLNHVNPLTGLGRHLKYIYSTFLMTLFLFCSIQR